jgi:hypothetical protein
VALSTPPHWNSLLVVIFGVAQGRGAHSEGEGATNNSKAKVHIAHSLFALSSFGSVPLAASWFPRRIVFPSPLLLAPQLVPTLSPTVETHEQPSTTRGLSRQHRICRSAFRARDTIASLTLQGRHWRR